MAPAQPGGAAADAALGPPHEAPLAEAQDDHPVDDCDREHDRDNGINRRHGESIAPRARGVHSDYAQYAYGFPAWSGIPPTVRSADLRMPRTSRRTTIPLNKEVQMFWVIVVFMFVALVLGFATYALVRPFTHFGYHHPQGSPWHPLD